MRVMIVYEKGNGYLATERRRQPGKVCAFKWDKRTRGCPARLAIGCHRLRRRGSMRPSSTCCRCWLRRGQGVLDYVPRRVSDELVEVLVRLDELGESVERRSPAGLVVCCRDAGRQPPVHTDHGGAAVCIA